MIDWCPWPELERALLAELDFEFERVYQFRHRGTGSGGLPSAAAARPQPDQMSPKSPARPRPPAKRAAPSRAPSAQRRRAGDRLGLEGVAQVAVEGAHRPRRGRCSCRAAGSGRSRRRAPRLRRGRVPPGTTRLARPMASASAAPTGRPVRIRSSALPWPTMRGRRTVPPSISGTPQRRQKTPKVALSDGDRGGRTRSASSSPPATA